jgi:hypothetical protein
VVVEQTDPEMFNTRAGHMTLAYRRTGFVRCGCKATTAISPAMTKSTALSAPTTMKKTRKRRVSPKIIEAIRLLASGAVATQKLAAERVGVTETWLSTMLGREETRILLQQTVQKCLRTGTVRASARLIELLDSASSRTALEASKHVLAISGHAPPRDGVTVNVGGNVGYVISLETPGNDDVVAEIGECGGVIRDRKPTSDPPTIDLIPDRPEDE